MSRSSRLVLKGCEQEQETCMKGYREQEQESCLKVELIFEERDVEGPEAAVMAPPQPLKSCLISPMMEETPCPLTLPESGAQPAPSPPWQCPQPC